MLHDSSLTVNGVNLGYETLGEGPDVLLVHGFGMTRMCWSNIIGRFPGRRVTALDMKGSGTSDKPADGKYSAVHQAELVLGFARQRDMKDLVLVGHSFGGTVCLQVAARMCQEGDARLCGLGIVAGAAYLHKRPYFLRCLSAPVIGEITVCLEPAVPGIWLGMQIAYVQRQAATWERARDCARSVHSPGGRQAILATARQMVPPDLGAFTCVYKDISVPTQLIWGRQDSIVPLSVGEELNTVIPHCKLEVLDRCGHCPQDEDPERTAELISKLF